MSMDKGHQIVPSPGAESKVLLCSFLSNLNIGGYVPRPFSYFTWHGFYKKKSSTFQVSGLSVYQEEEPCQGLSTEEKRD